MVANSSTPAHDAGCDRRWRHLGLGLAAAKERLALTVRNVIHRNVQITVALGP
jgi:hypothetical protein